MARTDEQARPADGPDLANQRGGTDRLRAPATAADRPRPWSAEDLRQRLERLPRGHPSSPRDADGSRRPPPPDLRALELPDSDQAPPDEAAARPPTDVADEPGAEADGARRPDAGPDASPSARDRAQPDQREAPLPPLTDAEHAEHVTQVRELLDQAREKGLATEQQYLVDEHRGIWSKERRDVHDALVDALYSQAKDLPNDRMAIMAGGLGGAGKSTVLNKDAGADTSRYLTINPDVIKEEMATRGLIPQIDGLTPMEASDLVHEESSHIAKLLAERALAGGKNVIWDITMASRSTTERRLDDLASSDYTVTGIFVDIPVKESIQRADYRHRDGHERYRNGVGYGGRYVPPEVINSQTHPTWGCANRLTFEDIKHRFVSWAVYDNSVRGREALLIWSSSESESPEQRRNSE